MKDFNLSLLREKFSIKDAEDPAPALSCASNRIDMPLTLANGKQEVFVIRTQTMHTCLRMASRILGSFQRAGPLMHRAQPVIWEELWDQALEGFEKSYNQHIWGAIYESGKPIFQDGQPHPFLDLVEEIDFATPQGYDKAVASAEQSYRAQGKDIAIHHDRTVGVVLSVSETAARTGIILRGGYKTTTFNFVTEPKGSSPVSAVQCLNIAAAYLEGIQLAFRIGKVTALIDLGQLKKGAPDYTEVVQAKNRLPRLQREILDFENSLKVRYRPDKPNFNELIESSRRETEKRFD